MRSTRTASLAACAALLLPPLLAACTDSPAPRTPPPKRPPSTSPAGDGPFGAPARIPSAPGLPGWAHGVGFAADGSGFVLLVQCVTDEARPANGFCRQQVAVLDRGARSWMPRSTPLPEIPATRGVTAGLTVLGSGRALIEDGGGDEPERTWFTRDGGRTWRAVDRRTAGRTPAIPDGGVLTTACAAPEGAGPDACARERLVVISPEDGRRRALAGAPELGAHPAPAPVAEPDGSWWVSGVDPASGRVAVAVSRDAGRSWTAGPLPSPGGRNAARHVTVVVGPDAVYAAEPGDPAEPGGGEPVRNPLRALHRSLDGGRTWTRTWTTGPAREPRSLSGLPVPGPGGRVWVPGDLRAYESTDGGRTFRSSAHGTAWVRRTGIGLLREDDRCLFRSTRDGVRWSEFRLACVDPVGDAG
ncbi:exo-alpha-sialidase [Streptomyces roseicoloratus]|uniref:exo-alpha-sialidase n=1 Tax=Streptomyces roseicoloratus TaxID=2508722 RepID=UPI001FE2C70E|nr:exo-alpha-sialidase [Streptomyces roseicoloratus]